MRALSKCNNGLFKWRAKKAINAGIDKPLVVVASAGTGKTTVFTHRIVELVNVHGIKCSEIVVFTYTDTIANNMRNEIRDHLIGNVDDIFMGTIHSFFNKLLKYCLPTKLEKNLV